MSDLKIETAYSDRIFTTMCINGFSPKEMNEILEDRDALGKLMEKHGHGNTYECWHNGYGIYSVRHCGGDLFVQIGNSCD